MIFSISKNVEITRTSTKSENSWLQWLCILIETLPIFTFGLQSGWISPVTPLNHTESTAVTLPNDVAPWTVAAMFFAAAVSSSPYGYIADKFGRRRAIVFVSIPQLISWIFLLIPNDTTMFLMSRVFSGVAAGGLFVIIPSYLMEISEEYYRGSSICLALLMQCAGFLTMHVLGTFVDYYNVVYIVLALPIFHMIMTVFVMESPSFLVKACKFQEAAHSLAKLRRLKIDDPQVAIYVNALKIESERAKGINGFYLVSILRNQIWRNAFKIGIALQTVRTLGGSFVIIDYSSEVLVRSRMTVDPHIQTLAVPGILLASCLVSTFLVDRCERKILLTASSSIMAVSLGVLAVFMQTELTVMYHNWLPLTMLVISVIAYGIGFFAVPFVVMTEMLNLEIRATILGVIFTYTWLLTFTQTYVFKYIEQYLGLDAIIYIYAAINMYGVIHSLFSVPETLNKSTRMIEKQLKRSPLLKF